MISPTDVEALAQDRQERMERELRKSMLYRSLSPAGKTSRWELPALVRRAGRSTWRTLGLWLQAIGERMAGPPDPVLEIPPRGRKLVAPPLPSARQHPLHYPSNNGECRSTAVTSN